MAASQEAFLSIGQVLRPQGLKGQVKVRPDTDDPARFLALDRVFLGLDPASSKAVNVSQVSVRGNFVYLNFGEDSTPEAAELRRGQLLYIPREEAVPLGEFENFITDLIGCIVKDTKGSVIGTLVDVLQPGANDVYVVKTVKGNLLIPALRHVVLNVDVTQKTILVSEDTLAEVSVFEN